MAAVRAVGTYTDAGVADAETVVIGGKTYTWKTTLTDTDGFVTIGGSNTIALANLRKAINLTGVAGTDYATSATIHPSVKATSSDASTLVVQAKVPGVEGNFIATTETGASASWGAATLAGGTGSVETDIDAILAACQVNADILGRLLPLSSSRS
jgi:hypothetical protein